MIRRVSLADAQALCEIYNPYILESIVTFEEVPVTEAQMQTRIQDAPVHLPWFVYEEKEKVLAYAYAGVWKERSAYRFTVETTVYVHPEARGKGLGSLLYHQLLQELKAKGFHIAVACLALPNPESQKLHEKFGFKPVAIFSQVGFKFGSWLDVGYWELKLEDFPSFYLESFRGEA